MSSKADLDLTDSVHQCKLMVQPCDMGCIAVIFIFDFSYGCSSNSSVQCIYGGFIVCVVLVANVSVQSRSREIKFGIII